MCELCIPVRTCTHCNRPLLETPEYFERWLTRPKGLSLWCRKCLRTYRVVEPTVPRISKSRHGTIRKHEIFERDNWTCGLCGEKVPKEKRHPDPLSASLDHIIPLSRGGEHERYNVQCAHLFCNVSKGNRAVGEQLRLAG